MGIKHLKNRELARITAGATLPDDGVNGKYGKVLGGFMSTAKGQQADVIKRVGHFQFVQLIKYVLNTGEFPRTDPGHPVDGGDTGGDTDDRTNVGDGAVPESPIVGGI